MSRHSFTAGVIEFVTAREGEWIDAIRFEQFGRQAWRTRISNARKVLEARGEGTIQNRVVSIRTTTQDGERKLYKLSEYRFVSSQPSLLAQMEQPSA